MSWWSVLLVEETGGLGENHNISVMSWRSVLLAEETGGLGENQRPVASH
jgi:hypothetical protein